MVSFLICLTVLIIAYFTYGKFVEKQFEPDDRDTPAVTLSDGVDYVVLPKWRIFLIQLLNIAGLGPIWGAVGGALWGPSVFLWITLGTIFAGGIHDFASGFISMRNEGKSISEVCGNYMGKGFRTVIRCLSVILLFMVGVVFAKGPSGLISHLFTQSGIGLDLFQDEAFWLTIIIVYYFIATFVPIDAIISKIYPVFGICLVVMALGVGIGIFLNGTAFNIPEIWNVLDKNMHPETQSAWPMMFVSVACGAVSGFHSTQSPIMARCCKSEKQCRSIFYGAMVCEGIIALIWAAAACALFGIAGGKMTGLKEAMASGQSACIYLMCSKTMGKAGVALAMLGVIACPITSGDTAFRSARLTLADWFHIDQKDWKKRLAIAAPLLVAAYFVCHMNYTAVWNYFSSVNQMLAAVVLWTAAMYLMKNGRKPWIAVIPATFMTSVSCSCVLSSNLYLGKLFAGSAQTIGNIGGLLVAIVVMILFGISYNKQRNIESR